MDVIAHAQNECEKQIKLLNVVASYYAVQSKNKRTMKGLEMMQIMDDTVAVDIGLESAEVDKIKCPYHDKLITRAECLDFSGTADNFEKCQGCETGKDTKAKLLPPQN
jgi:hypothetical protein